MDYDWYRLGYFEDKNYEHYNNYRGDNLMKIIP